MVQLREILKVMILYLRIQDHAGILELINRMPDHLKLPILMQYFGTDDMEEIKTELL